ncbi:hypothetical protein GE118_00305 [Mycoplasma sp. NEAQ87857]|uniref:hypothetical protein n=1 Tax=Mycoplasma sp. NEAQ87857 TaxID=2683967 RepID=UPI001316F67A|nr:hypothetical protein [Mycoplasma sp. NEAQ87857]QGZ97245.1 hypothetical protein GE118_00305 [Mycoplasma sp. NEAQ87857]
MLFKAISSDSNFTHSKKDRDQYDHHARDAATISLISNNTKSLYNTLNIDNDVNYFITPSNEVVWERTLTGEIVTQPSLKELQQFIKVNEIADVISQKIGNKWYELKNEVKFSRKPKLKNNTALFNDTLYSYKFDDNNKDQIVKIEKLSLYDEQKIAKYFKNDIDDNDCENLLLYNSHRFNYNKLKSIYNDEQFKGKNPFVIYMNHLKTLTNLPKEVNSEFIDKMINNKKFILFNDTFDKYEIIKYLKYKSDSKDINNVKFRTVNNSNIGFYESFNSLGAIVLSNGINFKKIPINFEIIKFGSIDTNKLTLQDIDHKLLEKYMSKNNIDKTYKTVCIAKSGDLLVSINKLNEVEFLYISSFTSSNQNIELKLINQKTEKRIRKSVDQLFKGTNYIPVEKTILGNSLNEVKNIWGIKNK